MSLPPERPTRARELLKRLEGGQALTRPTFNKEEAEHRYRGYVLVAIFGLLVMELGAVMLAWLRYGVDVEEVKDMAAIILTPTFTLLGTVVGFYFSRSR